MKRKAEQGRGGETRTTVDAERARLEENERVQREHPDAFAERGRQQGRANAEDQLDPTEDDRLRARDNEDVSEG
jgi:hypothetical protein